MEAPKRLLPFSLLYNSNQTLNLTPLILLGKHFFKVHLSSPTDVDASPVAPITLVLPEYWSFTNLSRFRALGLGEFYVSF